MSHTGFWPRRPPPPPPWPPPPPRPGPPRPPCRRRAPRARSAGRACGGAWAVTQPAARLLGGCWKELFLGVGSSTWAAVEAAAWLRTHGGRAQQGCARNAGDPRQERWTGVRVAWPARASCSPPALCGSRSRNLPAASSACSRAGLKTRERVQQRTWHAMAGAARWGPLLKYVHIEAVLWSHLLLQANLTANLQRRFDRDGGLSHGASPCGDKRTAFTWASFAFHIAPLDSNITNTTPGERAAHDCWVSKWRNAHGRMRKMAAGLSC